MNGTLEISRVVPAPPERIYNAFLNPHEHAALTGEKASIEPDGSFLAGNGHIRARTLELETAKHIVQNWRSNEFPEGAPDSRLEIALTPSKDGGTKVSLKQSGLPEDAVEKVKNAWNIQYFDRMESYFHSPASRVREAGEAVVHVAEDAQEALEAAAEKAQALAKKAQNQMKQAVKKATTQLKKAAKPLKKAQTAAKKGLAKAKTVAKKAVAKAKPKPKDKPKAKPQAKPAAKKVAAKKVATKRPTKAKKK